MGTAKKVKNNYAKCMQYFTAIYVSSVHGFIF